MHIRREFDLEFDPQVYLSYHGERLERLLENPSVRAGFDAALDEVPSVCQPAAVYDTFPVERFMHQQIKLVNGIRIGGGPVVQVTAGAEELVIAVCTVGREVDQRIKEHARKKRRFQMMVLDELATWAVDQIRLQLFQDIADEYAATGWRASTCLSPGESSWSIQEQRVIFELLDTDSIGVTLSPSCVMTPLKSLSLAFGIGPNEMGVEDASNCDFCSLKERCRYSLLRAV